MKFKSGDRVRLRRSARLHIATRGRWVLGTIIKSFHLSPDRYLYRVRFDESVMEVEVAEQDLAAVSPLEALGWCAE